MFGGVFDGEVGFWREVLEFRANSFIGILIITFLVIPQAMVFLFIFANDLKLNYN